MSELHNSELKSYSRCKGCGQEIKWVLTKNGKSTPVNLDGFTHWATCSKAETFKRK